MKTIVLRSNDRVRISDSQAVVDVAHGAKVWQLMDSVGADRVKYKTRLFCGGALSSMTAHICVGAREM